MLSEEARERLETKARRLEDLSRAYPAKSAERMARDQSAADLREALAELTELRERLEQPALGTSGQSVSAPQRGPAPGGSPLAELTQEMLEAGIASLGSDDDRPTALVVSDLWNAMSAASPSGSPLAFRRGEEERLREAIDRHVGSYRGDDAGKWRDLVLSFTTPEDALAAHVAVSEGRIDTSVLSIPQALSPLPEPSPNVGGER